LGKGPWGLGGDRRTVRGWQKGRKREEKTREQKEITVRNTY